MKTKLLLFFLILLGAVVQYTHAESLLELVVKKIDNMSADEKRFYLVEEYLRQPMGAAAVDQKDKEGKTALWWAVYRSAFRTAQLLIKSGANVNSVDNEGVTPLIVATRWGDRKLMNILINAKADINKADHEGRAPLIWAIVKNDEKAVDLLINAKVDPKADVNKADKHGSTPLLAALKLHRYSYPIIDRLITAGANVHTADNDHMFPLFIASNNRDPQLVKRLIDAGAKSDVNRVDQSTGEVPLYLAALEAVYDKDPSVVNLLLSAGADANKAINLFKSKMAAEKSAVIKKEYTDAIQLLTQAIQKK